MSPTPYTNRRKLLGAIAGAGVLASGASVAAAQEELPADVVESVRQRPAVERIAAITGELDPAGGTRRQVAVAGRTATVTELDTQFGTLTVVEPEFGAASARLAVEDISAEPALARTLADEYRSVPTGAPLEVALLSGGDSVQLVREVTARERRTLRTALARATRGATYAEAVYDSDLDGYRVFAETPGARRGRADGGSSDVQQYEVGAGGAEVSAATVERVESPGDGEVTVQGCPFTLECFNCANAVVARGICLASCATGPDPICLACIASTTFYPLACVPCLQDCA